VAFETPPESVAAQAKDGAAFELFADQVQALRNPERDVLKLMLVFDESVRGLTPGAVVDFRGIAIGEVAAVKIEIDPAGHKVLMPVEVNLYPDRLRQRSVGKIPPKLDAKQRAAFLEGMVAKGLRAQMRTGNLLTGQLYIALDFFPGAPKAAIDWKTSPPELPTTPGSLQELQASLKVIASKIDKIPFEQISTDLRQTLQSANAMITRLDTQVAPELTAAVVEARKALGSAQGMMANDAPLQQDTREAIRELARTAKAFRVLADYLDRHPEALIRGRQEDEK
jgi:paraquat-inducible protein B